MLILFYKMNLFARHGVCATGSGEFFRRSATKNNRQLKVLLKRKILPWNLLEKKIEEETEENSPKDRWRIFELLKFVIPISKFKTWNIRYSKSKFSF